MNLLAACAFGLEAIVKRELIAMGYEDAKVSQPGRIRFQGDWADICRTNIELRTADRVLIEVVQFPALDFDSLFETLKAFDFRSLLPQNASFPVSGKSRLSQLTSVPAIQRTTKKAIVESLRQTYRTQTIAEDGPTYAVEIALLEDVATLTIDTTGPSLHKRGYRHPGADSPIKETLAAALVILSVWNESRVMVDPFCGSGTIPIEAAMIGMNVAPGMNRSFASSPWSNFGPGMWEDARTTARENIDHETRLQIIATDSDPHVLSVARAQAERAGVENQIHFQQKPFQELRSKRQYGCIVTNPPCSDEDDHRPLENLYLGIPGVMQRLPSWSLFLLTNMPRFERMIGQPANRRRKLFNNRLECTYYQFLGPKPPRLDRVTQPSERETPILEETPTADPGELAFAAQSSDTASSDTPPEAKPDPTPEATVPNPAPEPNSEPPVAQAAAPAPSESVTPEQAVTDPVTPQDSPSADSSESDSEPPEPAPPEPALPEQAPPEQAKSDAVDSPPAEAAATPAKPVQKSFAPIFGGIEDKDQEQAELFHNRLQKLARHLRRWPTKRGITCFRLYEKDIPEIPLVVDRYENHLHITEYERPHERSLSRHGAWLELMKKTAASTLDIPIQNVHLKQRLKNRDHSQYEKVGNTGNFFEVQESGLKFLVNLEDYVDTGLFLDHRNTRQAVGEQASGQDFLNLFAYTGSFSVYAAAAGARSTTTVDLSKNYLEWARKNFVINHFGGTQHRFVASDAMSFLDQALRNPKMRYSLAVVDPPTFSNSKATQDDWDVQANHAELLSRLRKLMKPEGVVYFSTNFRRFKLSELDIEGYAIHEISKQSVPEDFRNRRIHRCWRMTVE